MYSFIGGYSVGWYAEGIQKDMKWYEDNYSGIFKCYYQKNKGVCFARNVGIKNATGEFISFVDSDDYI